MADPVYPERNATGRKCGTYGLEWEEITIFTGLALSRAPLERGEGGPVQTQSSLAGPASGLGLAFALRANRPAIT